MKITDFCLGHTISPIQGVVSNLIIRRTTRKLTRPSINRRSLHYNPITSGDIVVARYRAKNPQTWKVSQRNISARWKIQLLFHTADLPLIVISLRSIAHLSAEYRISLFTPAGKEVSLLYYHRWNGCFHFFGWISLKSIDDEVTVPLWACLFSAERWRLVGWEGFAVCANFCMGGSCDAYRSVSRGMPRAVQQIIGYCRISAYTCEYPKQLTGCSEKSMSRSPEASPGLTATNTKTSWYIRSLSHETHVLLLSRIESIRSISPFYPQADFA